MTERAEGLPTRVLPCGHAVAELVDLAAGAEDVPVGFAQHAATCPHCQPELARLRPAWQLVRTAAEQPVATPPELVGRVLDSLRGLRARPWARAIELVEPDGTLSVAEPVVVVLARTLVRERAQDRGDVWERGVELTEQGLVVRVAVAYGVDITVAADDLRHHVRAGLAGHLASSVPAVRVDVVDVVAR
jgi:uncharacterized alkaline shock family protein YloU